MFRARYLAMSAWICGASRKVGHGITGDPAGQPPISRLSLTGDNVLRLHSKLTCRLPASIIAGRS